MYTKDTRNDINSNKDLNSRDTTNLSGDFQKIRDKMSETRDAISQTASHAKKRAEQLLQTSLHDMKDRTVDFQENAITYVKGNPIKAIGFAILAGLLVATWLRK